MPTIHSANADLPQLSFPLGKHQYTHPAIKRKSGIPMAFQVTSPFDRTRVLLPHALVMHVNPQSFQTTYSKQVERIQTRGGWVEQHWGDNLDEIHGDGSTGAFMNIYTGLTSVLRQRTIAWDRFRDLHDLYRNNGSVYDPSGNIVLQGQIMLLFDMGVYTGTFRTFEFEETGDSPFAFHVTWTFKVEHTIMSFPGAGTGRPLWGPQARVPTFQGQNTMGAPNNVAAQVASDAAYTKALEDEEVQRKKQIAAWAWQDKARAAAGLPSRAEIAQQTRADQARELGVPIPLSIPITANPGPPNAATYGRRGGRTET